MNIKFNVSPQYIFLFLGIIYGIAFLFLIPPFQVPDEYEHYYKAYDVSEGNIISDKLGNKAGIYVPKSVKIATDITYQKWMFYIKNGKKIDLKNLLNLPLKNDEKIFIDISKYAVVTYSPITYIAPALAMVAGKSINLSPLALMYLGRFANLMLYILLVFFTIKITPVFKWGFLVIALMPMTLFQAASISADSFTIGLSFLTIAIFLKFALDENKHKINLNDILMLFLIFLMLGLAKVPYFLLISLFLMIPVYKFGNKKNMIFIMATIFLFTLSVIGIWNFLVKGLYMPMDFGISIKDQLFYILYHPFGFIEAIKNTFIEYTASFPILNVGNWAFGNSLLPKWIYSSYLVVIIGISLFEKNRLKINFKQRFVMLGTFILLLGSIVTLEYLTWTEVGLNIIRGLQGRYFIPILPLLFLFFVNRRLRMNIGNNNLNLMAIVFIIFILAYTVFIFKNSYFI